MSLTTLASIISGKTTNYASFRDIEIRSEDGSVKVYDLFQFTRYANKKHNPFLKPNEYAAWLTTIATLGVLGSQIADYIQ
ncbi:hypothetical protein EW093_13035 [Thiospirochaeta perfilievii]|uniref:Uncharacterized protein n=1 Tax=Thiospirochaeta perfilievii TaxID=252967 RepID=A0A5C1QE01_9SPIO|nr:hypothetical protein [Thiospirochaeta perfilievii]QEN05598.1 hypothetical protein EW093_13035 [Thiospirochaeta perfilievii]